MHVRKDRSKLQVKVIKRVAKRNPASLGKRGSNRKKKSLTKNPADLGKEGQQRLLKRILVAQ
jgi:hypothetical protein